MNPTDEARHVIEAVAAIESQIEDLQDEIRKHKQTLQAFVGNALVSSSKEAIQEFTPVLYWLHEDYIPTETIKKALGYKRHETPEECQNFAFTMQCGLCGNSTPVIFKSRGQRQSLMQQVKREEKRGHRHRWILCEECQTKTKQEQERIARSNAEHAEQRYQYLEWLRTMPYYEYLQTDHWKETRKSALKRAAFRCQVCNTNERTLHVHHRTYERRGQENPKDLIVLCESCHQTFHENGELA